MGVLDGKLFDYEEAWKGGSVISEPPIIISARYKWPRDGEQSMGQPWQQGEDNGDQTPGSGLTHWQIPRIARPWPIIETTLKGESIDISLDDAGQTSWDWGLQSNYRNKNKSGAYVQTIPFGRSAKGVPGNYYFLYGYPITLAGTQIINLSLQGTLDITVDGDNYKKRFTVLAGIILTNTIQYVKEPTGQTRIGGWKRMTPEMIKVSNGSLGTWTPEMTILNENFIPETKLVGETLEIKHSQRLILGNHISRNQCIIIWGIKMIKSDESTDSDMTSLIDRPTMRIKISDGQIPMFIRPFKTVGY